jgi:curved DNA-binding protein
VNQKKNYYDILGLTPGASSEEIRRAYRILARRYHPDVNPGAESTEKFRAIAEAYEFLTDAKKKVSLDEIYSAQARTAFVEKIKAYEEAQKRAKQYQTDQAAARERLSPAKKKIKSKPIKSKESLVTIARQWFDEKYVKAKNFIKRAKSPRAVSLLELPLTLAEAVYGGKKVVDIPDSTMKIKKISIKIPKGTRPGEMLKLRRKNEELVFIIKILPHKKIALEQKGICFTIEVSFSEAVQGSSVLLPTPDGEVSLHIPPKTRSGMEFKLKEKGIVERDGTRGDLYVKVIIQIPDDVSSITQSFPTPSSRPTAGSTFESLLSGS